MNAPALTPLFPQYIDSTMVSCFRSCPRKFYYEFILGLRPTALSVDLHAGGCFATALETYYRHFWTANADHRTALREALAAFATAWGDFTAPEGHTKTFENVWAAVESYFERYGAATDHIRPFYNPDGTPSLEFTFAIPLTPARDSVDDGESFPLHPSGDPFFYSGRFDMLGSYNSMPIVRDEKTTKSIAANWAEQWDLRSQFIGYTWACQQLGIDCDAVSCRGVGILKTKISHAEAIIPYSQALRDRWFEQLRRDLWRMRRAWDAEYFDYNLAESCSSYGGCAFRHPCSSPEPERWYSGYVVRRWNPLQKNPIEETVPQQKAA